MKRFIKAACLLLTLLSGRAGLAGQPLRLGVLAFRPKPQAMAQWQPLAAHLEARLGRPVVLSVYDQPEFNVAVAQGEVDVVITNPAHFILLQQRNHLSPPLATQIVLEQGRELSEFGGVIFTRADHAGIHRLEDLRGRRVAAAHGDSFGGYLMQTLELTEAGMAAPKGERLLATGMPQDRVVEAVLAGQAEAGFVRSGVIEAMVQEGRFDAARLRFIHLKAFPDFPFPTSTPLYPEWPVAVMPQVETVVARQLTIALLTLPPDSVAARSARVQGFTNPADYRQVEALLRKLRHPPYDVSPEFTLGDLWNRYAAGISLLAAGIGLMALMGGSLLVLNRRLAVMQSRLRLALDSGRMGVWDWNVEKDELVWDEQMLGQFGLPIGARPGGMEAWLGAVHPGDVERVKQESLVALREKRGFTSEFRVPQPNGGLKHLLVAGQVFQNTAGVPTRMVGVSWDITDRKEAEAVLRRSEEKFALAFHASPDAIVISTLPDGICRLVNEGFARIFGYSDTEVLGKSALELGIWADLAARERWVETLRRDGKVDNLEITFRRANGVVAHGLLSSRTVTWDGELLQLSITRDITERRQMELSLQESEERHRLLFNHSLDAILFTNPDGEILDANPAACRMFGHTVEEIRVGGRPMVLDTSDPRLPQALEERARTGRWAGELTCIRKDGTLFPCEMSSAIFTDRHGRPKASVIIRDISERRQAEALRQQLNAEIQQSQKLDSLGSLAGGVAHDMNNILAAIQAVTETLRMKVGDDPQFNPSLGLIDRAATRGRDLVKGLTRFARKELQEAEILDLNPLVEEEINLLRRTTLQKVDLVMDLEGALRPVLGERNALASALMNLCVNAVDAMPEGGTLTLRTRNLSGGRVELVVEDTGVGMSPEVAARAMDPFFTTKPVGKGTGLGLAMAYATAQTHGGTLSLRSEPCRGTSVSLRLPALHEASPHQGSPQATLKPEGALKMLLVDDDDLILAAAPTLIETLGHHVTTAAGGAEALAILESGVPVDLVILDLNMPGMNGLETLGRLRQRWPELPVLLATGHLDERAEQALRTDPRTLTMAKPYTKDELNVKLQALRAGFA